MAEIFMGQLGCGVSKIYTVWLGYGAAGDLKSDNLQYNTLGRWVDGTIVSLTKHLIQVLFIFIISGKLLLKIPSN